MLTSEPPFVGGIGNVVFGGAETTGVLVFVLTGWLSLQATSEIKVAARNKDKSSDLFVEVILYCGPFMLFLGERVTGHSILTFNPPAEINKLTPLRTEGTKRIVFPLDRLTAGWTFHES
jgi:hypothetical protein